MRFWKKQRNNTSEKRPNVKLLLDECIDRRLAREFKGHFIRTVPQMGWAGIKNGALLKLASQDFDVLITVDRNLSFQQMLPKFDIAVVVLHSKSSRLSDMKLLVQKILSTLSSTKPGKLTHVGI